MTDILEPKQANRPIKTPFSLKEVKLYTSKKKADFTFETKIAGKELIAPSPISDLISVLQEVSDLQKHKAPLLTILSELYSNALDHGILELNSAIKDEPKGFSKYLELKNARLANLNDEYIIIRLSLTKINALNHLTIFFEDSGAGFPHQMIKTSLPSLESLSGRGIYMIQTLCNDFEFHGAGNQSTTLYSWSND